MVGSEVIPVQFVGQLVVLYFGVELHHPLVHIAEGMQVEDFPIQVALSHAGDTLMRLRMAAATSPSFRCFWMLATYCQSSRGRAWDTRAASRLIKL